MKKQLLKVMLFLLFIASQANAQNHVVTGKVIGVDDGLPLPGVSVVVKGTKIGTQTSSEGKYSISVPSGKTVLLFTYIGYKITEKAIDGSIVNVSLETDTKALSEVVVTGVGVATSKAKLAFDVTAISSKQLPATPSASIDQALIGKIPGAQISSRNGTPGQSVNILLRGINTLGGTSPMILLDGIQLKTDLNSVDMSNIDRVEVVQGAASATIYGAQGANGVIQLFSKRGRAGQTHIDFSSSATVNELINKGNVHQALFHSFVTDANNNVIAPSGNIIKFDPVLSYYPESLTWNSLDPLNQNNKPYNANLQYYDHNAMFFQKSNSVNNTVAIYGGSEKMDYNLSGSQNYQTTTFKNNGDYKRYNFSANFGIELFKNLKFRTVTQIANTINTINDNTGRNFIYSVNNSRPFANYDYQDASGNYGAYFGDDVGVNGYNPNYNTQYTHRYNNKIDIIENLNLNYQFPKFVELDAKYGLNYSLQQNKYLIDPQDANANAGYTSDYLTGFYGSPQITNTGETQNQTFSDTFRNFIATAYFRTDFKNDFHINFPLKTTTQLQYDYRNDKTKNLQNYGADAPSYTPYNSTNYLIYQNVADNVVPFITYGFLANQRFDFDDFGGFSAGLRSDYSSAFGGGSKPFTFPRADAYIRPSSFDFWKDSKLGNIIPEFKLRAAYGEAGIQPGAFARYITLSPVNVGTASAFTNSVNQPNPDLQVINSKETELGADLKINGFKNSNWLKDFNITFSYWKNTTGNDIYNVSDAPSTGIGSILENAFGLTSHGIQAAINLNLLETKKFKWNFTANFGKSTSELSSVIGPPVVITSAAGSTNLVLKQGEKIGQLYGFLMIHSVDAKAPDGTYFIPQAQQASYTVASNGWVVNSATKQPFVTSNQYSFGDPNPKFNMSFINGFQYKDFVSLDFQIDWVSGNHLYNQTKEWMYRDGISGDYDKPITINGQTGAWTAFYRGVYAQVSRNGTKNYFYEDASYARLRNVSLAFNIDKLIHLKTIKRLQLVLSGRNVFTITKYTGYDPEISSGAGNSAFDRGVDHNTTPNNKTYQVGLNIGL